MTAMASPMPGVLARVGQRALVFGQAAPSAYGSPRGDSESQAGLGQGPFEGAKTLGIVREAALGSTRVRVDAEMILADVNTGVERRAIHLARVLGL